MKPMRRIELATIEKVKLRCLPVDLPGKQRFKFSRVVFYDYFKNLFFPSREHLLKKYFQPASFLRYK